NKATKSTAAARVTFVIVGPPEAEWHGESAGRSPVAVIQVEQFSRPTSCGPNRGGAADCAARSSPSLPRARSRQFLFRRQRRGDFTRFVRLTRGPQSREVHQPAE